MSEATIPAETSVETAPATAPVGFVPRPRRITDLTTITAISFSLTFVGVSLMFLAGVMPPSFTSLATPIDIGVLLLIVPLCALVLAMIVEVMRAAITGGPPRRARRNATSLSNRRP